MTAGRELPRLLMVSDWPPVTGGIGVSSSIVLERLFSGYPDDRITYVALSPSPRDFQISPRVRERLIRLSAFRERYDRLSQVARWANIMLHPQFVAQIHSLAKRTRSELIFASPIMYGHLFRAAVAASRRLNIPFAAYLLDDWTECYRIGWPALFERATAWQTEAITGASILYTNGPGMQEQYQRQYGVESSIVTNVVDVDNFVRESSAISRNQSGNRRIVYTGTIYGAQEDAIGNLVEALDITNGGGLSCNLDLYSNLSPDDLVQREWARPYVSAKPGVPASELPKVLASAHILFLPLSFSPEWSYTVRTAAPGKLAEYAASGRPIIIHAPRQASVSILSRQLDLGLVVDRPEPALLSDAIKRLSTNREYALELSRTAVEVARRHYDQKTVQKALYERLAAVVSTNRPERTATRGAKWFKGLRV